MTAQQILLAVIITSTVLTTVSTLLLAGYAWSRRPAAGTIPFLFFMLTVTLWSIGQSLELTTPNFDLKLMLIQLQFGGVVFSPYFWIFFALSYTGREEHSTNFTRVTLAIFPIIAWILALTNEAHGLIWQVVSLNPLNPFLPLDVVYGIGFVTYIFYGIAAVFVGGFLFVRAFISQRFYRPQVILLSICTVIAITGVALHVQSDSVIGAFQPITISFALASSLGAYVVISYRVFDVVPVARGRLVDRMRDGVIILDTKDRIIDMNMAAAEILQKPAKNVVGNMVYDVLLDYPSLIEAYKDTRLRPTEIEFTKNGEPVSYEVNVTRLHDAHRALGGRIMLLHDISERKRLEKIRHDLTYTMVHDLRNPITSNLSMLQLLDNHLDELPIEDRQEMIAAALSSMSRTLRLVDQIMEVNSLESGEVPLEPTIVHLAPLASDLLQAQFSLAAEKGLQLDNDIMMTLPPAFADPDMIARVMQNLVGNAVKFTPAGSLIRISATVGSDNKLYVFVSDNGPGIAPEVADRLFEKFAVGPNKGRGSGLGLAFCKMVIEAHGERIWVEESSSRGTTFGFTLPIASQSANGRGPANAIGSTFKNLAPLSDSTPAETPNNPQQS